MPGNAANPAGGSARRGRARLPLPSLFEITSAPSTRTPKAAPQGSPPARLVSFASITGGALPLRPTAL
ncbi:hypothetical protein [Streptomyces griseus]|uniref:hypothetical protein n=1 Tax=Streptomyces griseus TaxID=1911 RepID=UPI00055E9D65|nr:hypothetical protein [Streptomyces griseus]